MKLNYHPSSLTAELTKQASGTIRVMWKSFSTDVTNLRRGSGEVRKQNRLTLSVSTLKSQTPVDRMRRIYTTSEHALAAKMLERLKLGEDQRVEKVHSTKSALNSDEYENDLKLHVAVTRLFEVLEIEMDTQG